MYVRDLLYNTSFVVFTHTCQKSYKNNVSSLTSPNATGAYSPSPLVPQYQQSTLNQYSFHPITGITYLLDRLRRQHVRTLLIHTDTILNSHANTPRPSRPSLIIRHVYARLYRNTHAWLKRSIPGQPRTVMHIKTDIMADMVWEERLNGIARHVEAEVFETIGQGA